MDVVITGKQVRITETLRKYIHERAQKAEKYLSHPAHLMLTLKTEKYRKIAEAHLNVNGFTLQAEEETDAMPVSVDKVMAKIERQLNRHKDKISDHRGGRDRVRHSRFLPMPRERDRAVALRAVSGIADGHSSDATEDAGRVPALRRKTCRMETLTVEEALLRMASKREERLLFRKVPDDRCCLLSRNKNGQLELLEAVG